LKANGYVILSDLDSPERQLLYAEMEAWQDRFLRKTAQSQWRSWFSWPPDPLRQWSRQWEYPYAFAGLSTLKSEARLLDAGSGLTFFPYYCEAKGLRVTCLDAEPRYGPAYEETNRTLGGSVVFVEGPLEAIPLPEASFDAVTCISVLEHTASWRACLPELARILHVGGVLVLTVDVNWGGHEGIDPDDLSEMHLRLLEEFVDLLPPRLVPTSALLTTSYFRRHDARRLPWVDSQRDDPLIRRIVRALRGRSPPFEPLALAGFQLEKRA